MAYDMHGSWESKTGHHALSHKMPSDDRSEGTTNIEWIIEKWISLGADPAKLSLGSLSIFLKKFLRFSFRFGCLWAII